MNVFKRLLYVVLSPIFIAVICVVGCVSLFSELFRYIIKGSRGNNPKYYMATWPEAIEYYYEKLREE